MELLKHMWKPLLFCCAVYYFTPHEVSGQTCTAAGRIPDTSVTNCTQYILCVLLSDGSFAQYDYTCPTTSVFNPNTAQCTASSNYNCTSTNTTASDPCTEEGFIANPAVSNCSSYLICTADSNGTLTGTVMDCPDGTYYDPSTTLCESSYVCTTSSNDTCTAAGRIPNTSVSGCKGYILCVLSGTDTYTAYNYTCPTTSVFNPTTSQCTASTNYNCTT